MKTMMIASLGMALLLTGCGGGGGLSRSLDTAPPTLAGSVSDYPAKLGEPYVLEGITYTPVDVFNYDETGYASWYGKELNGRSTANGELFSPDAISGAHRTLPLPSYVEVTALDTGKTILVRVNDRGPASASRLIDLSYGAAKQLGVLEKGSFPVRVRRVNPPEAERAVLRTGQPVAMRMETPESLLVPLRRKLGDNGPAVAIAQPVVAPVAGKVQDKPIKASKPKVAAVAKAAPTSGAATPSVSGQVAQGNTGFIVEGQGPRPTQSPPSRPTIAGNSTGANRATPEPAPAKAPPNPAVAARPVTAEAYFIQVAAFSTRARADDLAKRIGANTVVSNDGKVFRVRYGPYANAHAAQQGLTLAKRNGYQGVRIQQDPGR
ncbi:septal ring lytic transglycosylase RlpA family protein [Blastomonas aquatica]|uniref:Endolytic peptidoglycan transglycosylase RlpA n=1 Tax=Blastomonas aquatica TaxID=1510276 RepID=A0ABQ1JKX8_9SPHN|nr:septal ring lytic transglycosylase RlpA family protein [Blastomonas aquatica]GGB68860.1 rare lipoprotein A [Blastomonas aquatica]